jgi:hypothetical protein
MQFAFDEIQRPITAYIICPVCHAVNHFEDSQGPLAFGLLGSNLDRPWSHAPTRALRLLVAW